MAEVFRARTARNCVCLKVILWRLDRELTVCCLSPEAKLPDVDGFLVGGASLKPEFVNIVNSKKD